MNITSAPVNDGPIALEWRRLDSERTMILERVRECAAYTKPSIAPPLNQNEQSALPRSFQSVGPRGTVSIEGKLLLATFPPSSPWMGYQLPPEIENATDVTDDEKQRMADLLWRRGVQVQASIESARLSGDGRVPVSFHSKARNALCPIFVTGETLVRMSDDLGLAVIPRHCYVTQRDADGDVVLHIVQEMKDPLTLSKDMQEKSGINVGELSKLPRGRRQMPLYTQCEWNGSQWVTTQEINGQKINEFSSRVSRYGSVVFDLAPGEHYGRGWVELNLGDFRSLNRLNQSLVAWAANASKLHPAIDNGSTVIESDLTKENGTPIRCRVEAGQVQDIAFLRIDKNTDFTVVATTSERIEQSLSKSMLLGSESVRQSERTTAFEVQRVTVAELEQTLGGFYAAIADSFQTWLVLCAEEILESKMLLKPLPKELNGKVRRVMMTGLMALSNESRVGRIITYAQTIAQLGDEAMQVIDPVVLANVLARYQNIYEPGLVKSPERLKADQQQKAMQAAAEAFATEGAAVAGDVARSQLVGA